MYEIRARVKYSETDENGRMTAAALVNSLQDCSTFHSADVGLSVETLRERQRVWLLSYWDIYIFRTPELYERITVGTSPHAFRGVLAHRNFWIQDERGDYLLKADSVWAFYDTEHGRPAKIDGQTLLPFGERKDVLCLPESPRRIELPELSACGEGLPVRRHQIDSNHHVNNAQYIALAEDALLAEGFRIPGEPLKRIRAEYRRAAVLGDVLLPWIGKTEDGHVVSLQNEEGEVYCNVEIR